MTTPEREAAEPGPDPRYAHTRLPRGPKWRPYTQPLTGLLIEVRQRYSALRSDPFGLLHVPADATFTTIVPALLDCIGYADDGHLWEFLVNEDGESPRKGTSRRVPRTDIILIPEAHADIYNWIPDNVETAEQRITDVLPWHGDGCWWHFDFGDDHVFRLRFIDPAARFTLAVKTAKQVLGITQGQLPTTAEPRVLTHLDCGEQYGLWDD